MLRNSPSYSEEYIKAVYGITNRGDTADLLIDDRGIYIIQYLDEAQTDIDRLSDQIRSYLETKDETNVQIDEYNKWTENYLYNVDCETLKVKESEIIRYGSAFSDLTS